MEWLIEVTGLPFDILILVLLAVAGAFAGFVDSIVGGGGLISVPAMLLTITGRRGGAPAHPDSRGTGPRERATPGAQCPPGRG